MHTGNGSNRTHQKRYDLRSGEWNEYEITVDGADFTVELNSQVVNRFHSQAIHNRPNAG